MIPLTAPIQKIVRTGGEDTAHIGLYIKWKGDKFKHMLDDLKKLQEEYKASKKDCDVIPQFPIGKYLFEVKPYGYNPGESKYSYYPVVIETGGIRFCLSEREIRDYETEKRPNVRIEIGSLPLICYPLEEVYSIVKGIIADMGGVIKKNRLARVDACVDMADMDISQLQKAMQEGRFICRARKKKSFVELDQYHDGVNLGFYQEGRQDTGITIGAAGIVCRIYEKAIESRFNEDKVLALLNYRWDKDETPEKAVRCEFQLRRDSLRNIYVHRQAEGIKSVEDWILCRAHILEYLCTVWMRMYKRNLDWRHPERFQERDILYAWMQITEAFRAWAGEGCKFLISRRSGVKQITADKLARQGIGCIFSAYVRQGHRVNFNDPDALEQFINLLVMQVIIWWNAHDKEADKIQARKVIDYSGQVLPELQNDEPMSAA